MPHPSSWRTARAPALDDPARLAELGRLRILDSPPEQDYDAIATLGAAVCRSPVAAVNFVDGRRHFTKAIVGMPGGPGSSVPNGVSFCAETILSPDGLLVIPDTQVDARWRDHPLVTGGPHVGFYAGAAIVSRGERIGVVCAFGPAARAVSPQEQTALVTLAQQAAGHLQLRLHNAELHDLAVTDSLTGLPNRGLLMDRMHVALAARPQAGSSTGVLFCDVDEFKAVNDRWGHDQGDRLLCRVAVCLRAATRAGDTVARIAGDEFVALCPGLTGRRELDAVVERVADAIAGTHGDDADAPRLSLSVGAVLARPGEDAREVLRRADAAMYEEKARRAQLLVTL